MFDYSSRSLKRLGTGASFVVVTSCFRYMDYKNISHFMINVLNLKLCFVTLRRSDGEVRFVIRARLHFVHSNLNLLKEFLYFSD